MMKKIFFLILINLGLATSAFGAKSQLDAIVVHVNDNVITQTELDGEMQRITKQLQQSQTQMPDDSVLRKQVLDHMINQEIQLQFAKQVGIKVDDMMLNEHIKSTAKQQNLSLHQLRDKIKEDGYSFPKFRQALRKELIINQLQQYEISPRIKITEQEVKNQLALSKQNPNTAYHLYHIMLALPDTPAPQDVQSLKEKAQKIVDKIKGGADFQKLAVTESNGPNALKGGDFGWRKAAELPTIFVTTLNHMAPDEVSAPIQTSNGFHIIKLVESKNKPAKHYSQEIHVRHILIKTDTMTPNSVARNRLNKLKTQIQHGESFTKLAGVYSQDPGSATKGGDLGWMTPGHFAPEFEVAMKKLSKGQLSSPIKTAYGWHLIQVVNKRTVEDTKNFEQAQIKQLIFRRKFDQKLQNWVAQMRGSAYIKILK